MPRRKNKDLWLFPFSRKVVDLVVGSGGNYQNEHFMS